MPKKRIHTCDDLEQDAKDATLLHCRVCGRVWMHKPVHKPHKTDR